MAYEQNNNEYASKGVGTASLTTGIIGTVGTAIATGILGGNGMGGLFGGNQNPAASPIYQLSQKDNEIALLKAQQYSDNKTFALAEKVSGLESRIIAIETAAPLRDKILSDSILSLQTQMAEISVRKVPNYALAPGYGPAVVGAVPPPGYVLQPVVVQGGSTSTPATATTAQAA